MTELVSDPADDATPGLAVALHVALFARSLGGGGGAERVVLQLAAALAARGHRVDLVLGRAQGRFMSEVPATVRLINLQYPPALRAFPTLLRTPRLLRTLMPGLVLPGVAQVLGAIPGLAAYLRRERPAALISALDFANFTALAAIEVAQVPVLSLVTVHNHLSTAIAHAERAHLRQIPRIARQLYPRADAIVAVSQGVAADVCKLLDLPAERVTTIYNPVVTASMAVQAAAPPLHPWLAAGAVVPVILGVGKLKPQKDFATLLRAFAQARATRDLRLIILGDGPQRAALIALAEQLGVSASVELVGFRPNPYAYMSRAALFVLSSAWEGFGNVLVEAMACGCPVVSTACPSGPDEILDAGRYGRLVPVGAVTALADAMLTTLAAPLPSATLRQRAADFTAARCAEHYERLVQRVAHERHGIMRAATPNQGTVRPLSGNEHSSS
jgi:glycosyltransferase involved in cell wall biosynthesis